jgi:hypothetical protein
MSSTHLILRSSQSSLAAEDSRSRKDIPSSLQAGTCSTPLSLLTNFSMARARKDRSAETICCVSWDSSVFCRRIQIDPTPPRQLHPLPRCHAPRILYFAVNTSNLSHDLKIFYPLPHSLIPEKRPAAMNSNEG